VLAGATAATAAPPEREVIRLVCDNGQTYDIVVNGNGAWTPGRDIASTGVLVPISFGPFVFTVDTPTEPPVTEEDPTVDVKGSGKAGAQRDIFSCTFTETETFTEETELEPGFVVPAGTVVTFTGTVTGFVTGRR
jgi:hypothetical protein